MWYGDDMVNMYKGYGDEMVSLYRVYNFGGGVESLNATSECGVEQS